VTPDAQHSSDEQEMDFCDLLEAVEDWIRDSDMTDLCTPQHMVNVGLLLMTVGMRLSMLQEFGLASTKH
jgi:hypothetical protein